MDKKSSGFTLIELIVVVAFFGILIAIAVPRLGDFTSVARERVCVANRKVVVRVYSAFLVESDVDHSDSMFDYYFNENFEEVCPAGGVINYEDGKVECSVHEGESEGDQDEEPGEEVPWL